MNRVLQRPTADQIAAADPARSPWVGANAGSGKTRVLTQRVARLLLSGAAPEKILCLTYTKAAAAEMQNRLFAMLGDWAMAPDEWLAEQLALLEGRENGAPSLEALARARRLFARALETPGGLKIQTIHAFCDALLRRFPLEAGVSPRFDVLDDRQAMLMQRELRLRLARAAERGRDDAFDRVAGRLNEGDVDLLIAAVKTLRDGFPGGIGQRLGAHFGEASALTPRDVATSALATLELAEITRLARTLEAEGGANDRKCAATIGPVEALAPLDPVKAAETLIGAYLKEDETPRSRKGFPVKKLLQAYPWADGLTDRLIEWAVETRERFKTARTIARTRDLDTFASRLLDEYEAEKARRGLLDFDDLIARAHDLLVRSDMGVWVLWKLDQGIDHILVDEAQDTSPRQWALIEAIAAEFHAGEGAREAGRTLFVVGDEKQSIYSFQGAEPSAFGTTRDRLGAWLDAMGQRLERPGLATSFRSAPGILAFVDAVFDGEAAKGLTVGEEPVRHLAHRTSDAARVDLWPLVPPPDKPEEPEWWQPVDRPPPDDPKTRLAGTLAAEIARILQEERLPPRDGRPGSRVHAGDVLVLVTRRDRLATTLIRRLKSLGVPVAGADRLTLTGELAVRDLLALARVATTPADDLSLAALLRSPLCDLSEEQLFELAHDRGKRSLDHTLAERTAEFPMAAHLVADMRARADYLRPYEFLERALIHHDGRRRLIARLGLEAEDPIDELLAAALDYERQETPSLAGFIDWIAAGEIQVKREMEIGQDAVRVMTVHGAKGLEAPVVILPDTMSKPHPGSGPKLHRIGGDDAPLVLWSRAKAQDDAVTARARAEAEARAEDERRRLLYVALTRAEDWLILCGAGDPARTDGCWYGLLAEGMERLGRAATVPGPQGLGDIRRFEDHPVPVEEAAWPEAATDDPEATTRPGWLGPAPTELRPRRMTPSGLGAHDEVLAGAEGGVRDRATALLRGAAVHRLLEELPGEPEALRDDLARRLLAAEFPDLAVGEADSALAEVETVLAAPFADTVFGDGSLAEVGITLAPPEPGLPMIGRIDRLIVRPDRVLVVDFKTDALPPDRPDASPEGYLKQLAAYRAGAALLFPDRQVSAAILWTATPTLMELPATLLSG